MMKPIAKLYIMTFLLTGISFGLIMMGINIIDGKGFRLWEFLFQVFFFGATMSIIFVTYHSYKLKKMGVQELTVENLKVSQTKSFKSKLNREELIEKLKTDPKIGKLSTTKLENGVLINSGMSWASWGEAIKIIQKYKSDDEFEYQVSSSPKFKLTLIDYGKNLENVIRVQNVVQNVA